MVEQPLLSRQAASVTRQGCVGSNYTVTGNDDVDRVEPVCRSNRAKGGRTSDAACKFTVGDGSPDRNPQQLVPDAALERCPVHTHRKRGEGADLTCEVSLKGAVSGRPCRPGNDCDRAVLKKEAAVHPDLVVDPIGDTKAVIDIGQQDELPDRSALSLKEERFDQRCILFASVSGQVRHDQAVFGSCVLGRKAARTPMIGRKAQTWNTKAMLV